MKEYAVNITLNGEVKIYDNDHYDWYDTFGERIPERRVVLAVMGRRGDHEKDRRTHLPILRNCI